MVIRNLLKYGIDLLIEENNKTPQRNTEVFSPQSDAAVLLCHTLKKDRLYLVTNSEREVSEEEKACFLYSIQQRSQGKPVAYIIGEKEFMSLPFRVTSDVLIPRPDTETLCEWVIEQSNGKAPHILDIGTGSGCIGISLAKYIPEARVYCVDISSAALKVAEENAERNGVKDRIAFWQMDILKDIPKDNFDFVVSNPPYIETEVIPTLSVDVAEYEPYSALDGGKDGLVFYRRLAQISPALLKSGGMVAFEVGHTQAQAVAQLLIEDFVGIQQLCDLAGIERVVCGIKR